MSIDENKLNAVLKSLYDTRIGNHEGIGYNNINVVSRKEVGDIMYSLIEKKLAEKNHKHPNLYRITQLGIESLEKNKSNPLDGYRIIQKELEAEKAQLHADKELDRKFKKNMAKNAQLTRWLLIPTLVISLLTLLGHFLGWFK